MESAKPDKLISWTAYHREGGGRKVMHDGSLKDSERLYHMLPWPYALAIFEDRRLRLSPVGDWDDPYERSWCDLLFGRAGPLSGQRAYGLCWTTGIYDEPRWRMAAFRKTHPIVRIRCQVGPLLVACRSTLASRAGAFFLGTVRYAPESSLLAEARSVAAGARKEVTRSAATMLVRKRIAFAFEHEVRLLWLERATPVDAFYVDIDPTALIDQVMISPYADAEASTIRAAFRPHRVSVKQSGIMRAPLWASPGAA
jgi:hypothetical protein